MGSFTGPKIEDTDILFTINAIDKNSYVGSGTSVSDLIGSNDATLTNGVAYDSDGYFELDGSNDYIVLTSAPFTAANGEFTVSFWCRPDVYGQHKRIISWGGSSGTRFFIGYNNNSSTFDMGIGNQTVTPSPTVVPPTDGSWTKIDITNTTVGGNSTKFYKNGLLTVSTSHTNSATISSDEARIGRQYGSNGEYWNGGIGQVTIYSRALTATELKHNFENQKTKYGFNI